jgi:hypothetical protein
MYVESKRADFSVAIKNGGKPINTPWRWEISRSGQPKAILVSSETFPTMGAAFRAGKQALAEFFEKNHILE